MIINILKFVLKTAIGIALFVLIAGRIFFPHTTNEVFIKPAREIPFFGSVLGTAWDGAGEIGPAITRKTVEMADYAEATQLNLSDPVLGVAESNDPKEEINKAIEEQVNEKLQQVKDLPDTVIEDLKQQIREEILSQVCQDWEQSETESDQATSNKETTQ